MAKELTKAEKVAKLQAEIDSLNGVQKVKMVPVRATGPGVFCFNGVKVPIGDIVEVPEVMADYLENNTPQIATTKIKAGKVVDVKKDEKKDKDVNGKGKEKDGKTVEKKQ